MLLLPTAVFPGEPGSVSSPSGLDPVPVSEENLWELIEKGFLKAGRPSCHPAISVKSIKGTQSNNANQRPGLILSYQQR